MVMSYVEGLPLAWKPSNVGARYAQLERSACLAFFNAHRAHRFTIEARNIIRIMRTHPTKWHTYRFSTSKMTYLISAARHSAS